MKVVLFCGGQGMRIREVSDRVPKPMVRVGDRPILLHVMKYYAHFGHTEFILCLGYQGHVIKEYFLNYNEAHVNDFILDKGKVELLGANINDWRITFVDSGVHASVGERLWAVREHLQGEERFLANYADCLTGANLPDMINFAEKQDSVATFMSCKPPYSFHVTRHTEDGTVWDMTPVRDTGMRINGGWFVLKGEIFDYMRKGEELVEEPFRRLIAEGRLSAYSYDGFWACMDTFKEKQMLDDLCAKGIAPWEVWKQPQRKIAPELKSETTPRIPSFV